MARAGAEMQASARMRALQALEGMSNTARGIRADDWRSASAKAAAQDRLNEYNNEHKLKVKAFNNSVRQQRADNDWRKLVAQGNAEQGHATSIEGNAQRFNEGMGNLAQGTLTIGAGLDKAERDRQQQGADDDDDRGY